MAIISTEYEVGGRIFVRTVSDVNRYVVRDGNIYIEANDPKELNRTYTEGDPIEYIPDENDYAEAARILLGVSE